MPNTNYQKGRAREYRLRTKYQKKGNIVLRTSGSHGFADLIVISKKKNITFIQVKPRKFSRNAKKKLEEEYSWLNNEFRVKFKVE